MGVDERRARLQKNMQYVLKNTASTWVKNVISDIHEAGCQNTGGALQYFVQDTKDKRQKKKKKTRQDTHTHK